MSFILKVDDKMMSLPIFTIAPNEYHLPSIFFFQLFSFLIKLFRLQSENIGYS